MTDEIRKKLKEILTNIFDEDMGHNVGLWHQENRKRTIQITLCHWGKPRFWTTQVLMEVMKCGLKLNRFEAPEETCVIGVFNLK